MATLDTPSCPRPGESNALNLSDATPLEDHGRPLNTHRNRGTGDQAEASPARHAASLGSKPIAACAGLVEGRRNRSGT